MKKTDLKNLMEKRGFSIIPIQYKNKIPFSGFDLKSYINGEKFSNAADIDEWKKKYTNYNIGIICGKPSDRLVVFDIDDEDLFSKFYPNGADSLYVKTGKGYHVYYKSNGSTETRSLKIKRNGETEIHHLKGDGGYVIGPGSIHPSGKSYTSEDLVGKKKIKTLENPYNTFLRRFQELEAEGILEIETIEDVSNKKIKFASYGKKSRVPKLFEVFDYYSDNTQWTSGDRYTRIGYCPFHGKMDEASLKKRKGTSFHADNNLGKYYCFSCLKKGDALDFIQHVEGCNFSEANDKYENITGETTDVRYRRKLPDTYQREPIDYQYVDKTNYQVVRQAADCINDFNGDYRYLDLLLALRISAKSNSKNPLWFIIIGPSSSGKTSIMSLAVDDGTNTLEMNTMTSKTLIHGNAKSEIIGPYLHNRLWVIKDLAEVLSKNHEERNQIFGQLRNLYDGYLEKADGMTGLKKLTGLYTTFLAASTPNYDEQSSHYNALGTRELVFRINEVSNKNIFEKLSDIDFDYKKASKFARDIFNCYVEKREMQEELEIPKDVDNIIRELCEFLPIARASGKTDRQTNELSFNVHPEKAGRIYLQIRRLYRALKSIHDDYTDEEAIDIIRKVVFDSADPYRIQILRAIKKYIDETKVEDKPRKQFTSYNLRKICDLGNAVIISNLEILTALGFLRRTEIINDYNNKVSKREYTIKKNKFNIFLNNLPEFSSAKREPLYTKDISPLLSTNSNQKKTHNIKAKRDKKNKSKSKEYVGPTFADEIFTYFSNPQTKEHYLKVLPNVMDISEDELSKFITQSVKSGKLREEGNKIWRD